MNENNDLNKKPRLWIIEDDPVLLKVFLSACRIKYADNVDVISTMDGLKAIDELKLNLFPNVVVLDLMLPGASGFEVLKAMRELPEWKTVPVVILSNLSQEEDVERGKKLGVDKYLVKADVKMEKVLEILSTYFTF